MYVTPSGIFRELDFFWPEPALAAAPDSQYVNGVAAHSKNSAEGRTNASISATARGSMITRKVILVEEILTVIEDRQTPHQVAVPGLPPSAPAPQR